MVDKAGRDTEPPDVVKLRVHYPSGTNFEVDAIRFMVGVSKEIGWAVGVERPNGEILILDPRAVVFKDGEEIHNPRNCLDEVPKWVREYLRDHPRFFPLKRS